MLWFLADEKKKHFQRLISMEVFDSCYVYCSSVDFCFCPNISLFENIWKKKTFPKKAKKVQIKSSPRWNELRSEQRADVMIEETQ